ncbi:hypothetical protein JRO89_XS13G0060600 [Xanthoceras sorbifolium]|uniref:4Fe-4S ferredoxin-type domain-containing protein n=1 Tax=Xanthoceras sorbifolium TaxID=99658 RepID=A0ABQ8H6U2_9ROSI|nr:hypothetical protein JRO89_XS13G0060600 [Xanthoceras sorbifolium]
MTEALKLPIIDLSSPDRISTAKSIRQACIEFGFFYVVNHGVEEEFFRRMFEESSKLFSLPLEEKTKLSRKEHRGYTALYDEKLDPSSTSKGDSKESFYIGPLGGTISDLNQWPSKGNSRSSAILEIYYGMSAGRQLIHLIALALNLDEDFFEKVGALDVPMGFLRLLHYPGIEVKELHEAGNDQLRFAVQNSNSLQIKNPFLLGKLESSGEEIFWASAHSDYGMITLLATDGVPGLQVCRDKSQHPRVWEDVPNINGSTLHRVMPAGQERYSTMVCGPAAFFLDPNDDCVVECFESCCSEACPPRFPPIRSRDYLKERFRLTYGS